jgi:hypothetical protein
MTPKKNIMLQAIQKALFKPSVAWLYLFLPALSYFMSTRLRSMGLFRSSTYGDVADYKLDIIKGDCASLQKHSRSTFLYLANDCESLRYPIYNVLHEDTESIVSSTWQDDEELGRGYLLLSSQSRRGRIYRWETGGGPIAIGRTLHLQDSGCRSNHYHNCSLLEMMLGSGGIAVDATVPESPRLIVAEYGEGRITRLEENGARTPLVIQVGTQSGDETSNNKLRRLCEPFRLLVTSYKDLIILERTNSCDNINDVSDYVLWRLRKVTDIPGLPSLPVSRRAHEWTQIPNITEQQLPQRFFQSTAMGGIAMDMSGHRLLVTTKDSETNHVMVVSLPLSTDDDSDRDSFVGQSQLVLNYSAHAKQPGAIATDSNGNIYLVIDQGILVVSKSQDFVVKIQFPNLMLSAPIVDLTVGSDKFLYMTTEHTLLRFRIPSSVLMIDKESLRMNLNVI